MPTGVYIRKPLTEEQQARRRAVMSRIGKLFGHRRPKGFHIVQTLEGKIRHGIAVSKALKGRKTKPQSLETRIKRGIYRSGTDNPRWKGGTEHHRWLKKRWKQVNRERNIHLNAQYSARRKGAEGRFSLEDWIALKKSHGFRCVRCKRHESERALTRDHIVPLKLGGTNFIYNIQPLCRNCNSSKRDRVEQ